MHGNGICGRGGSGGEIVSPPVYYATGVFPARLLYKIFGHQYREYAWRIGGYMKRPRCYRNVNEFIAFLRRHHHTQVIEQIDIGAIYCGRAPSSSSSKKKNKNAKRRGRPAIQFDHLKFDIDINDYRCRPCSCGSHAQICNVCVYLLVAAIRILDIVLTEELGLARQTYFWVFSGRRGLHMWTLSENLNPALAVYLEPIRLCRRLLRDEQQRARILKYAQQMQAQPGCTLSPSQIATPDLAAEYMVPMLDRKVLQPGHLLRMPMSIHKSSGNIALILDTSHDDDDGDAILVHDLLHPCGSVNGMNWRQYYQSIAYLRRCTYAVYKR